MKRQILAIDDSKAMRYLLQTIFGKKYNVTAVPDGFSAMQWLRQRDLPDIIIADPRLPDTGNWEIIEYLKSSGIYGCIPVVVLSDLDAQETHSKCREVGVETYFNKPFNPLDLTKAIENILVCKSSTQKMKIA